MLRPYLLGGARSPGRATAGEVGLRVRLHCVGPARVHALLFTFDVSAGSRFQIVYDLALLSLPSLLSLGQEPEFQNSGYCGIAQSTLCTYRPRTELPGPAGKCEACLCCLDVSKLMLMSGGDSI